MRIYISGAMTGTDDFKEQFRKAEEELAKKGISVVNPAKLDCALPEDFSYEEFMMLDFTLIDLCDAVYMMEGWEKSRGASREYCYASAKGKEILFEKSERPD